MQVTVINNKHDNFCKRNLLIQCSCVGHCNYIEVFQTGDNTYYLSLIGQYAKSKIMKKRDKFNTIACLDTEQFKSFIDSFKQAKNIGVGLALTWLKDFCCIIEKVDCKNDCGAENFYTVSIYESKHKVKLIFDIVLMENQVNNIIKALEKWLIENNSEI